jgi:hypothetical protein
MKTPRGKITAGRRCKCGRSYNLFSYQLWETLCPDCRDEWRRRQLMWRHRFVDPVGKTTFHTSRGLKPEES